MNKLELLSRLENAVKLFEQKETIRANYQALERKDRPYEEKRKIGLFGKVILGLEIIYMLDYAGAFFLAIFMSELDKETYLVGIVLVVILLAIILTTEGRCSVRLGSL